MMASDVVKQINEMIELKGDCQMLLVIEDVSWLPKYVTWDIYDEDGPVYIEIHSDELDTN